MPMQVGVACVALCASLGVVAAAPASPTRPVLPIDRVDGIAPALAACWHSPDEGDEITVRMSFRRDGTVFGRPRITYMRARGGANGEAALATSFLRAVEACAPLRFTPGLGAAIAGRILLIRFIAPRREQRA